MTDEEKEIVTEDEQVATEDVEFAIVLIKKGDQLELQQLPDVRSPTYDELYREIVILKRNIEAEHSAVVHAEKMMQAAMQAQGMQKSGIITPPGAAS